MNESKSFAFVVDGHGACTRPMTAVGAEVSSGILTCEAEDFIGGLTGTSLQTFWEEQVGSLALWRFGSSQRELQLLAVGATTGGSDERVELTFRSSGADEALGDAGFVLVADPVVYLSQPLRTPMGQATAARRPALVSEFSESIGQRVEIKGGIASVDGLSLTLVSDPDYEPFLARSVYPPILDDNERPLEIGTMRGQGGVGSLDLTATRAITNDANGEAGVSIGGATWYKQPYVAYVDDEAVLLLGYNEAPVDGIFTYLSLRATLLTRQTVHPPETLVWDGCPTPIGQYCRVALLDPFDETAAFDLYDGASITYRGVVDNCEWTADLTAFSLEVSSVLLGVYATRLQGRQTVTLNARVDGTAQLGANYRAENEVSLQALRIIASYPPEAAQAARFQWVSDGNAVYRLHDSEQELTYTRPIRSFDGTTIARPGGLVYPPRTESESGIDVAYSLCPLARFYPIPAVDRTTPSYGQLARDADRASATWLDYGTAVTTNIFKSPKGSFAGEYIVAFQAETLSARRYDTTIFVTARIPFPLGAWTFEDVDGATAFTQARQSIVHYSLVPRIEPSVRGVRGLIDTDLVFAHVFEAVAAAQNPYGAPAWLQGARPTDATLSEDGRFRAGYLTAVNGALIGAPEEERVEALGTTVIHVCDALLQILTSTGFFRRADLATPATAQGPNGVFDRLPFGVGFGIPLDLIDLDSFDRVATRARVGGSDLAVTNLIIEGDDFDDVIEWVTESLLEPFSLILVQRADGRIALVDISYGATLTGSETLITDADLRSAPRVVPQNGDRRLTENIASGVIVKYPVLTEWARITAPQGAGPRPEFPAFGYAGGTKVTRSFSTARLGPSYAARSGGLRTALFQKVQSQPVVLDLPFAMTSTNFDTLETKVQRYLFSFNRVSPVIEIELPAGRVQLGETVLLSLSNWINTDGVGPLSAQSGIVLDLKQSVLTQTVLATIIIVPPVPEILDLVWAGSALVESYTDPVIKVDPAAFQSSDSVSSSANGLFIGSRAKLYDEFFTLKGEGTILSFDPALNELEVTWDAATTPQAGDVLAYGDAAGSVRGAVDAFAQIDVSFWR